MQIYNVPYNFKHEEKVFGGYVSIRQAIYLIFGATMLGIFFVPIINGITSINTCNKIHIIKFFIPNLIVFSDLIRLPN